MKLVKLQESNKKSGKIRAKGLKDEHDEVEGVIVSLEAIVDIQDSLNGAYQLIP